jgi:hypothetical protein
MDEIDLKDQKLQPHLLEKKGGMKWYSIFFTRILNVTVHNAHITYSTQNQKVHHLVYRNALLKAIINTYR